MMIAFHAVHVTWGKQCLTASNKLVGFTQDVHCNAFQQCHEDVHLVHLCHLYQKFQRWQIHWLQPYCPENFVADIFTLYCAFNLWILCRFIWGQTVYSLDFWCWKQTCHLVHSLHGLIHPICVLVKYTTKNYHFDIHEQWKFYLVNK